MISGRLRTKIIIQDRTETVGADGQVSPGWDTFATVYSSVEDGSGKESSAHDKINATITHTVTIRYLSGVKPEMRVVWSDNGTTRYLNIKATPEDRKHGRWIKLACMEDKD